MLTQHDLNAFKGLLERRFLTVRDEIRQMLLQSDAQSHVELAGRVPDFENSALADLLVDVSLADVGRHVGEIRDIDAALLRIAQGGYGVCIDCEEDIDVQRLRAYPTAKRCLACQVAHERRRAAPGSISL